MKRMFRYLTNLTIALCLVTEVYAQTFTQNNIHTWDVQIPGIQNSENLILNTENEISLQTIQYFDGLGRPVQTIKKGYSFSEKDVIQPTKYNFVGLDEENYEPYEWETTNGEYHISFQAELEEYYNSLFNDSFGKSPVEYEKSPLNRVLKKGFPGETWQLGAGNHPEKFEYLTNSITDNDLTAIRWDVIDGYCETTQEYEKNQLFVLKSVDEDNRTCLEFKDNKGQIVLKRKILEENVYADTYYLYDEFGLLRFVITPEGSAQAPNRFHSSFEFAKKYVYCYKYDTRKRLIEKQVPGKEPEYYIYNYNDQVIMYQDGNMRKFVNGLPAYEWLATKYDALGRVILTGITKAYPHSLPSEVQSEADLNPICWEYLKGAFSVGEVNYYSNEAFPLIINSFLTLNYYDGYMSSITAPPGPINIASNPNLNFTIPSSWNFDLGQDLEHVCGYPTVSFTNFEGLLLATTTYYDKRGRVIQERSQNHDRGYEYNTMLYDGLTDRVSRSTYQHNTDINHVLTQIEEHNIYRYDHAGRLLYRQYYLNNDLKYSISNTFNGLGQLERKTIFDGENQVQSILYQYNIRGWLTQVNDPEEINLDGNLFGEKILYNSIDENLGNNPLFNGNISSIMWQSVQPSGNSTPNVTGLKAYKFSYDNLDRLIRSDFTENMEGTWDNGETYSEIIGIPGTKNNYDLNGNILGMVRHGLRYPNNAIGIIDALTYYYCGNKLIAVNDEVKINNGGDFYEGGLTTIPNCDTPNLWELKYDSNGNLVSDKNKGIISIIYNYNNLPISINSPCDDRVEYKYDAKGNKLRQLYYNTGRLSKTTDFIGNFVYENGILAWIMTDEGRIIYKGNETFNSEYTLKDHLGNIRVVYKPGEKGNFVQQVSSYYPFGMTQKGLTVNSNDIPHVNEYLYNGKMMQDEMSLNWYDFGARFYDAVLGRFHVPDPMVEDHHDYTPYNYCFNNPINLIDPFGMDTVNASRREPAKKGDVVKIDENTYFPVNLEPTEISGKAKKKNGVALSGTDGKDNKDNTYGGNWFLLDWDMIKLLYHVFMQNTDFKKPVKPDAEEMLKQSIKAASEATKKAEDEEKKRIGDSVVTEYNYSVRVSEHSWKFKREFRITSTKPNRNKTKKNYRVLTPDEFSSFKHLSN